jgi:hypothetical protein
MRVHKRGEFLALIEAAETLAEFSNLGLDRVDIFRRKHPDFVPQPWWDYQATGSTEKQWQVNQFFLRQTWEGHFGKGGVFFLMRLLQMAHRVWEGLFGDERPTFAALTELECGSYPYQKAVMFLFEHPWRAKFCVQCQKRFVAVERNTRYCSESCSHIAHTKQKLDNWYKPGGGKDQREARTRKSRRAKTKRASGQRRVHSFGHKRA